MNLANYSESNDILSLRSYLQSKGGTFFETPGTIHVLRSNLKISYDFFTFDTFEINFIMAGFREIDMLKQLTVKFNAKLYQYKYKKFILYAL